MIHLLTDKPLRRGIFLFFLLLMTTGKLPAAETAPSGTSSPPVTLQAALAPQKVTIGDRVTYTLTLTRSPGVAIQLPEPPHSIDGLTLIENRKEKPERADGKIIEKGIYIYRVDRTGTVTFPAVEGTYLSDGKEKTVATRALSLTVPSLLPADMKDIHEIKPLEPPGFHLPAPFYITSALLLLALLGVIFWRRKKKRKALTFIERPRTPREEAEDALKELTAMSLVEKGELRKHCFLLSEIFRRYIERRFRIPAVEQTSEEIRRHLIPLKTDESAKEEIRLFLAHTDRVKYAGATSAREEIHRETERVERFLETTSRGEITEREADHVAF